jgi:hypothetical protein
LSYPVIAIGGRIVVTQQVAKYLINILPILIALPFQVFSTYRIIRALVSDLAYIAKLQSDHLNGRSGENRSSELVPILDNIRDELDFRKAVQRIWEGMCPVNLDADCDVDNIQMALKKTMWSVCSAPSTICDRGCHSFAAFVVFLLSITIIGADHVVVLLHILSFECRCVKTKTTTNEHV